MSLGRLRQNSDAAKLKHGRGERTASFTSYRLCVVGLYLILYWTSIDQRLSAQGLRHNTHPVSDCRVDQDSAMFDVESGCLFIR
jgi:hypothetical protein